MTASRITEWRKLPISLTELCLATTLRCGQSFRWRQCPDNSWTCALRGRVVQLSQDSTHIRYRSIWPLSVIDAPLTPPSSIAAAPDDVEDDTKELITHYLNLGPSLEEQYARWSKSDPNFRKKAPQFTGIRILRQDAWEALVGFICSSNNNIARIGQMVDKLCRHYGTFVAEVEGVEYWDFPPPERLTGDEVDGRFRDLGFGYRAKFLVVTARTVVEKGEGWLDGLRNEEVPAFGGTWRKGGEWKVEGRDGYRRAHEELLGLMGVGAKVADCVCLMGLGWGEAVPVDTHVWQIAQRDYRMGKGKHSSLTKQTYDDIATRFRTMWGQEAGWAQSVLFTANLRSFSERLTTKTEIKVEEDEQNIIEVTTEVKTEAKVSLKREADDIKPVLELDELNMTSSERVKRRRRK